ncbi:MAG: hypothetical protein OEM21_09060 [Nitrosopumilus sp.]|nr:hypothetical protein [Nitrosopumilus sp.]
MIFIPGQGFYDDGESITLTKIPEIWKDYTFIGYKIDGAWAKDNPPTIKMDRPHEVLAVFEKTDEGFVTQTGILIDSIPRVSTITIDDEVYLPDELPVTLEWDEGTTHVVSVENVVNEGADMRYSFDQWKDTESGTVRIVTAGEVDSLIALYDTQYYLRAITEYGSIEGGGWYDKDSTARFKVTEEFVTDNDDSIRYAFKSWDSGDYIKSVENSIPIQGPMTVKASWDEEYYLDIRSNIPDYVPAGSGFYPQGKSLALIAETEIRSESADINYVFDRWVSIGPNPVIISNTVSPSTSISIQNPYIIEARYTKSYLINAWTPYGSISGSGFYDEGDIAEIKVVSNEVIVKPGQIKKTFNGWDTRGAKIMDFSSEGSQSLEDITRPNLMVVADAPRNVTAQWTDQYYLNVRSSQGDVKGSGWYQPGSVVPISVSNPTQPPGMWSSYSFVGWSGDIESQSPTAKVIMSGPRSVVAEWQVDNTPGIINGIILGALGIAGYFVYTKTKNRGGSMTNIINTKKDGFSFDRRSLDSLIGKKTEPKFGGTAQTQTMPQKKFSIIDWLMGNDK